MKQTSNIYSKQNNWLKQHGKPMRRKMLFRDIKNLKSGVRFGTYSSGKSFMDKIERMIK